MAAGPDAPPLPTTSSSGVIAAALRDLGHLLLEALRVLWVAVTLPWQIGKLIADETTRREGVAYLVWSIALGIFAVPEIWAAVDSQRAWPTLSSTVGGIEGSHDWTAVLVVGVMVFGAIHLIRLKPSAAPAAVAAPGTPAAAARAVPPEVGNPEGALLVTPDGRLTQADTIQYMGWFKYYGFALVLVAAGYLVPLAVDASNKQLIGESLYGSIALVLFVIPSWFSYRLGQMVPFPPLFETFQMIEDRARWLAVVVAAGVVILLIHLAFYPWTGILPDLQHLNNFCKHSPDAICHK